MLPIILYGIAVIAALLHMWNVNPKKSPLEVLLSYIILFNIGVMGLLCFFGQVFQPDYVAKMIGWPTGNPFQFEVGIANLAFGVLGILAYWIRGNFWTATIIGTAIYMLGCFVGHVIQYFNHSDTAPYNIGAFIWFNDLFLPIIYLSLFYIWWSKTLPVVSPQADHFRDDNSNK